jgi:hypothetical protein
MMHKTQNKLGGSMFKKIMFVLIAICAIAFAMEKATVESSPDQLSVPQLLNYQGKLTQTNGNPVADSTYSITFRMFSAPAGGTALWTETQSIQTHAGIFNCLLGSTTTITSIPADGNCYLEMQVNPNPAMTPRIRIVSSAYAFLAKKADTASYALNAPLTRPITPPIATAELADNAVNSIKISDGTITRQDVINTFQAPYADTADYARGVSVPYVDSARVSVNSYNAYKLQGKDTIALSTKYVDEGQENAVTNTMIVNGAINTVKLADSAASNVKIADNAITSGKILDGTIARADVATNFKAPYSDTSDYARAVTLPYVDSSRVAVNAHKLQGKDTIALSAKYVDEGQTNSVSNTMIIDNAVTNTKISDGTIVRADVATNFKAPYSDTSDYARVVTLAYVDSSRVTTNAHKLQGKDTIALSAKFVDEGQANAITNTMIIDNAVTSAKISDGTIARVDVVNNFKAPYSDTSDYARAVNLAYVDSSRVATNAYKLQGKDTLALSSKFVDEGQANAITNTMITDNAVTSGKISDGTIVRADVASNFKAPYADTSDFARAVNVLYVDSARIATNAYKLQGKDTVALSAKFVDEGQTNAVTTGMIQDGAVIMSKINQASATTGQVIRWNGSAWVPGTDTTGGPPTGSAGGDLTGTYPSPTIANNAITSAKILDGTITGADIAKPLTLNGTANWPNAVLHVKNSAAGQGISIDSAGYVGLQVKYAFSDGINVARTDQSGFSVDTAGGSGIRVFYANFDGIGVDEVGYNALYTMYAGDNGVKVDSSASYGTYAYGNLAGGNFVASNAGATGLVAHSYGDVSTDTAIQAYGKGYATGGFYTGGLLDNKSAPCLISPELGIVTAGAGTLNNGEAEINFDPLFTENIRADVPIRITVTPKGKPAGFLYVTESKVTGFKVDMEVIPGLEKNSTNVTFDWIAFGTLKEYQTSPEAQAQWQKMIQERDAKRAAAKARNNVLRPK